MRRVTSKKFSVIYKDKTGAYRTATLSYPPSDSVMREYGMTEILSVQPIEIVIRRYFSDELEYYKKEKKNNGKRCKREAVESRH